MPPLISDLLTPVHLDPKPTATRRAEPPTGQAYPLLEPDLPFNTSKEPAQLITNIGGVISYLNVSHPEHLRYQKTRYPSGKVKDTFCNIYAYDLCHLVGHRINRYYVPREWWTDEARGKIEAGTPRIPAYGRTVKEYNANALYRWFATWGSSFHWVRQEDLTQLQEHCNSSGHLGVIVDKRKNGAHGHITVVVPEQCAQHLGIHARRNASGKVVNPLQSQAGSSNFEYGGSMIGGKPWFEDAGYMSACYG